jgi:hypothetical protein
VKVDVAYCSYCGKVSRDGGTQGDHEACLKRLTVIDPPRYCAECARRMVVQVTPAGWSARCSRHGEITSAR